MLKDILVPTKIGQYYVFTKKVLTIHITPFKVQGMLVIFSGKKVQVKNNISVDIETLTDEAVIAALVKIKKDIGSYDEVVTSLKSSTVIFKELTLPFIGREKLSMVVAYEVESLLPFALEKAAIDFMITHENKKEQKTTILVAATLQTNIDQQLKLFQQAGISLSLISVDMFALYTIYYVGIYATRKLEENKDFFAKHGKAELLVDFDSDVSRILYMQNGLLKAVRIVPYGIIDIAQSISNKLTISYQEVVNELLKTPTENVYSDEVQQELQLFFEEITKTLTFFEKQLLAEYQRPSKLLFAGQGCHLFNFAEIIQSFFNIPVKIISTYQILKTLGVQLDKKITVDAQDFVVLSTAFMDKYNDTINLLRHLDGPQDNRLLYKQIVAIIFMTALSLGVVYFKSSQELERWSKAYISSKKELVKTIERQMNIDIKKVKSLKDIVQKSEDVLQKERKLWFSFSQQSEHSYLELLQDLSVKIDKEAIGLDVKKISLSPEKVVIVGSVKSFEALELFSEELSELSLLTLDQKPRELSFTVELKIKEKEKSHD